MSGAPGSYLKNFSAQNLTVLPQIVVVNKYSLWVSVCLCVWSTDRQPIAIWNCQEGTAAKAKRNIRVIFLRHGKKFPFLPLSPCVWGSHNLELHLIHGAVCREPHGKPSLPKEGATTPPNRDTFLSGLHWTALPVQEKMFPYSWTNAYAAPDSIRVLTGRVIRPNHQYLTKSCFTLPDALALIIAYEVNSTLHIKYTIWLIYLQANILGLNWIPLPTRKVHRRQWCQSGNSP